MSGSFDVRISAPDLEFIINVLVNFVPDESRIVNLDVLKYIPDDSVVKESKSFESEEPPMIISW